MPLPPNGNNPGEQNRNATAGNPQFPQYPLSHTRTAQELHRDAMNLAAQGFMAQMRNLPHNAVLLFEQALERELAAIGQLAEPVEPTWSVLHRSAGWMAFHCRQYDTAAHLAHIALAGNPPADIEDELRTLLDAVRSVDEAPPSV